MRLSNNSDSTPNQLLLSQKWHFSKQLGMSVETTFPGKYLSDMDWACTSGVRAGLLTKVQDFLISGYENRLDATVLVEYYAYGKHQNIASIVANKPEKAIVICDNLTQFAVISEQF